MDLRKFFIPALAALGIVAGTVGSCRHEINRGKAIELGFSEISQVEDAFDRKDEKIPPVGYFLMTANDVPMKIFEAWNHANEGSSSPYLLFAEELAKITRDGDGGHRHNLADLLTVLPERAKEALQSVGEFNQAAIQIDRANGLLDKAWDESHIDHYHTETYVTTETTRDGKGNSHTRLVTKTRRVYDYTTHTYDYDSRAGDAAARTLNEVVEEHSELAFKERIPEVKSVGEENLKAMRESRKKDGKFDATQQAVAIANVWHEGSTVYIEMPEIADSWRSLRFDAISWDDAKNSSRSIFYTTHSHYDSGPKEFRVAESAIGHGKAFVEGVNKVTNGMVEATRLAPVLQDKIANYVAVVSEGKDGDRKKLGREILDGAKRLYSCNFPKGCDVKRFRSYAPPLFGLVGGVLGAATGFGLVVARQKVSASYEGVAR